jgi:ribonuclease VapC
MESRVGAGRCGSGGDRTVGSQSFGKGRHPTRLNLGDCFAYALARPLDEPLLLKAGGVAWSDVRSALAD